MTLAHIIERLTLVALGIALALATATTLRTAVEETMTPGLEALRRVVEVTR